MPHRHSIFDTIDLGATNNADLYLPDGNFAINVRGSHNIISVGAGTEKVTLHAGSFNIVALGTGDTQVTGTGNNNDVVIASKLGDKASIKLSGEQEFIVAGQADARITANGDGAYVSTFNGDSTVIANGYGDLIAVGAGVNKITANGAHDLIYVAGPQDPQYQTGGRTDMVQFDGDNDTITFGHAKITGSAAGMHDRVYVDGTTIGSVLRLGDSSRIFLTPGSNLDLKLGMTDTVQIGNNLGDYTGTVKIEHLGLSTVQLYHLAGLDNFAAVEANLTHVPSNWNLSLPGGGDILFVGPKPTAANFSFA